MSADRKKSDDDTFPVGSLWSYTSIAPSRLLGRAPMPPFTGSGLIIILDSHHGGGGGLNVMMMLYGVKGWFGPIRISRTILSDICERKV